MTSTDPLAHALLRSVGRLGRWATMHTRFEIPPAQARLLVLVEDLEPVRITSLSQADHTSQPATTNAVQRLESSGWVERVPDPTDARATLVRLTGAGREALSRTRAARTEALAPVLDRLTPAEQDDLVRAVATLDRLLEVAAGTPTTPPPA